MVYKLIVRSYCFFIAALSVASLVYVYAFPPESMRYSRYDVPHFTPNVEHPETQEPLDVNLLVRHYKGE